MAEPCATFLATEIDSQPSVIHSCGFHPPFNAHFQPGRARDIITGWDTLAHASELIAESCVSWGPILRRCGPDVSPY